MRTALTLGEEDWEAGRPQEKGWGREMPKGMTAMARNAPAARRGAW